MRTIILLLITSFSLLSCSNEDAFNNTTGMIGTWKLVATLADPGDGSGTYQDVDYEETISFYPDHSFVYLNDQRFCTEGNFFVSNDNSNRGELKFTNCPHMGMMDMSFSYTMDGNVLIVRAPCIEACGNKYIKISNDNGAVD